MTGLRKAQWIVVPALVLMMSACSNPLDSSSTDGVSFTPAPLGMDLCYQCHNVPGSNKVYEQVFGEWVLSRHANFDYYDSALRTGWPVDPFNMGSYGYSDIEGYPSYYSNPSIYSSNCTPCHMGPDDGGQILDANAGGALFDDPNLGEQYRFLISCEGCHVSGSGHFGGASPPYVPIPAFHQCTECHAPTDPMRVQQAFADAQHTDHHGPDSTRTWFDGSTSINDLLSFGDPSPIDTTTRVLGSRSFEAYVISATWLAANGGSWLFDGEETVNDTHYQGIWIANVPNELVVYTAPTARFGYVDLTGTSPNTGMVRADSVDSCTASCHGVHGFDLTINEQWFEGAHHPNIAVPLTTRTSRGQVIVEVAGPANWGAVDHGFGADCYRCHNSMGFAEVAPGYGDAVQTPPDTDGFITCNACHDGVNYPEAGNKRLRFTGSVALFDYRGDPLAYVDAGNSAVCVYCHQGREDGSGVDADIAAGSPTFRNMHYLPAGAMLYGRKGYEYAGKTYAGEHFHTLVGCARCHMAGGPSNEVGGHTFHMSHGGTENTSFCQQTCHPGMVALDDPWGAGPSASSDVAYMLTVLLHNAIEAYDSPADADTQPNIDYSTSYPYFGTTGPTQQWDGPAAKAAFNWQFVKKEPGAFAHNPSYAVQLLWDSYEDLYNNDSSIAPAPGALPVTRP
ncbi:MAG: hypothetical protein JSV00_05400 [bacterium]|nr:MAG: hypothetical protein JSV00_05400 [bacterium]